jgi:phenylacetate-CoA ligase
VGVVEIVEGQQPVPAGIVGDVVGTGLMNLAMPLIRYRVGDRGALAGSDPLCACGRLLPRALAIEGRAGDVLYTLDRRRVGQFNSVFRGNLAIREAQIIQETLDRVRVRYVPTPGFAGRDAHVIANRLRDRLGPVEVLFEPVAQLPRTSRGKFRGVICNLSPAERRRLDGPLSPTVVQSLEASCSDAVVGGL